MCTSLLQCEKVALRFRGNSLGERHDAHAQVISGKRQRIVKFVNQGVVENLFGLLADCLDYSELFEHGFYDGRDMRAVGDNADFGTEIPKRVRYVFGSEFAQCFRKFRVLCENLVRCTGNDVLNVYLSRMLSLYFATDDDGTVTGNSPCTTDRKRCVARVGRGKHQTGYHLGLKSIESRKFFRLFGKLDVKFREEVGNFPRVALGFSKTANIFDFFDDIEKDFLVKG